MTEYADIMARIARIEAAAKYSNLGGGEAFSCGTSREVTSPPENGRLIYWASIGTIRECRPTLGGAIVAVELCLADRIEAHIRQLSELEKARDALRGGT